MPAAVAIPAITAVAGMGYDAYQRSQDRKRQQQEAGARGVDPAELARQRELLDKWMGSGYTPEQLIQYLSMAPGGGTLGPAPTGRAWEGPDVGRFMDTNWGDVAKFQQRTPQELQALLSMLGAGNASMGMAGDLGEISIPQLRAVADYNKALLGGSKTAAARAIAPEAEALAEQQQGQRRAIEASGLRGGARDMALAEAMRTAHGQAGNLIPTAIREARNSAQGLGTSTAQLQQGALGQAANIFGTAEGAERANRQFGIGAEQANRQLGSNIELSRAGLDLQELLGRLNAQLTGRGQDMGWSSGLLNALMTGRGQDLQAILGRMGVDTTRLGQTDANFYNNRQNSLNYGQGLGQTAMGFWNLIQQQRNKGGYKAGSPWTPGPAGPAPTPWGDY